VLVDGADHRDDDRGEEDEEAPEDGGVDEAGDEPLEQLPLAQHDHGLVLDPLRDVAEAVDRLAEPDEVDEQLRPPPEQRPADREQRGERDSAERDVYGSRAFPRTALTIAPSSALR
jgi:hypothetical protein